MVPVFLWFMFMIYSFFFCQDLVSGGIPLVKASGRKRYRAPSDRKPPRTSRQAAKRQFGVSSETRQASHVKKQKKPIAFFLDLIFIICLIKNTIGISYGQRYPYLNMYTYMYVCVQFSGHDCAVAVLNSDLNKVLSEQFQKKKFQKLKKRKIVNILHKLCQFWKELFMIVILSGRLPLFIKYLKSYERYQHFFQKPK